MTKQLHDVNDTTNGKLDVSTLRERMSATSAVRVLDVRTPAEFETSHIPTAYNVPLDVLRQHREDVRSHLDDDDQVALVCRTGHRSSQAAQELAGVGLSNLSVLDGGMVAWEGADGPVIRGRQRWDTERQVRLVAGSIVFTSTVGSLALPRLKWIAAFVGGGLAYAAISNTCAMGDMLGKLPYNQGDTADARTLVARLAEAPKETA